MKKEEILRVLETSDEVKELIADSIAKSLSAEKRYKESQPYGEQTTKKALAVNISLGELTVEAIRDSSETDKNIEETLKKETKTVYTGRPMGIVSKNLYEMEDVYTLLNRSVNTIYFRKAAEAIRDADGQLRDIMEARDQFFDDDEENDFTDDELVYIVYSSLKDFLVAESVANEIVNLVEKRTLIRLPFLSKKKEMEVGDYLNSISGLSNFGDNQEERRTLNLELLELKNKLQSCNSINLSCNKISIYVNLMEQLVYSLIKKAKELTLVDELLKIGTVYLEFNYDRMYRAEEDFLDYVREKSSSKDYERILSSDERHQLKIFYRLIQHRIKLAKRMILLRNYFEKSLITIHLIDSQFTGSRKKNCMKLFSNFIDSFETLLEDDVRYSKVSGTIGWFSGMQDSLDRVLKIKQETVGLKDMEELFTFYLNLMKELGAHESKWTFYYNMR